MIFVIIINCQNKLVHVDLHLILLNLYIYLLIVNEEDAYPVET